MRRGLRNETVAVVVVVVFGAACGSETDPVDPDAGMPADAGGMETDAGGDPDAGGGMDAGATDAGPPACVLDTLLVTTSDFTTGGVGTVDIATGTVAFTEPWADQDVVSGLANCTPVVMERGAGNLQVQDAADPRTTLRTVDLNPAGSMGPYAANPQAVAGLGGDRAYVVLQASASVAVVDLAMGTVTSTIDLSGFAKPGDMDGNPDPVDIVVAGDRAYVGLGNYWFDSSFAIQFEGSELAVIDTATDMLVDVDATAMGVQGIDLAGENPWRGLWHDEATNQLYVGSAGDSFAIDGQIEVVDLATNASVGVVVTEMEMMAELNGFAVVAPTRIIAVAGDQVIAFDPTIDFPMSPEVLTTEATGILLHEGVLWVWSRTAKQPGLYALDPSDGTDVTPGTEPIIEVGTLPVLGVVPSP